MVKRRAWAGTDQLTGADTLTLVRKSKHDHHASLFGGVCCRVRTGPVSNCTSHSLLTLWSGIWINLVCGHLFGEERQTRGGKQPKNDILGPPEEIRKKEETLSLGPNEEIKQIRVFCEQLWGDASPSSARTVRMCHNTEAAEEIPLLLKGHVSV